MALSPELALAIESASNADKGPERIRGLLAIGPQFVTPSDVLAKLIAEARGRLDAQHYAPDPVLVAKRDRIRLYSAREAQRQREANG